MYKSLSRVSQEWSSVVENTVIDLKQLMGSLMETAAFA